MVGFDLLEARCETGRRTEVIIVHLLHRVEVVRRGRCSSQVGVPERSGRGGSSEVEGRGEMLGLGGPSRERGEGRRGRSVREGSQFGRAMGELTSAWVRAGSDRVKAG